VLGGGKTRGTEERRRLAKESERKWQMFSEPEKHVSEKATPIFGWWQQQ